MKSYQVVVFVSLYASVISLNNGLQQQSSPPSAKWAFAQSYSWVLSNNGNNFDSLAQQLPAPTQQTWQQEELLARQTQTQQEMEQQALQQAHQAKIRQEQLAIQEQQSRQAQIRQAMEQQAIQEKQNRQVQIRQAIHQLVIQEQQNRLAQIQQAMEQQALQEQARQAQIRHEQQAIQEQARQAQIRQEQQAMQEEQNRQAQIRQALEQQAVQEQTRQAQIRQEMEQQAIQVQQNLQDKIQQATKQQAIQEEQNRQIQIRQAMQQQTIQEQQNRIAQIWQAIEQQAIKGRELKQQQAVQEQALLKATQELALRQQALQQDLQQQQQANLRLQRDGQILPSDPYNVRSTSIRDSVEPNASNGQAPKIFPNTSQKNELLQEFIGDIYPKISYSNSNSNLINRYNGREPATNSNHNSIGRNENFGSLTESQSPQKSITSPIEQFNPEAECIFNCVQSQSNGQPIAMAMANSFYSLNKLTDPRIAVGSFAYTSV